MPGMQPPPKALAWLKAGKGFDRRRARRKFALDLNKISGNSSGTRDPSYKHVYAVPKIARLRKPNSRDVQLELRSFPGSCAAGHIEI